MDRSAPKVEVTLREREDFLEAARVPVVWSEFRVWVGLRAEAVDFETEEGFGIEGRVLGTEAEDLGCIRCFGDWGLGASCSSSLRAETL